jgi:lysophospholipase L1-like esterase
MKIRLLNRRRLFALALGFAASLALFELTLRLTGAFERHFWQVEGRAVRSDKPVVLFVGNSHTMGSGAEPEKSFPNQLADRLTNRNHGSMPFEFVNVGRGNANSSFIVESLPAFLNQYRPQYVVVMTGETNQWNHYGYSKFASKSIRSDLFSSLYDLAYHIRVFRFVQLFDEFVIKPRDGRIFSSQTENDRALYWIAALENANMFNISKMSAEEINEARRSLETFLEGHPNHFGALLTASGLRLDSASAEDRKIGFSMLQRAYSVNASRYNFSIDRTVTIYAKNAQAEDVKLWARQLEKQRPDEYLLFVELYDKLRTPSSIAEASVERRLAFYAAASAADPTNSIVRTVLYSQQALAKRYEDAIETLVNGAELNPFSNMMDWFAALLEIRKRVRDEMPERAPHVLDKVERAIADFKSRYPNHASSARFISKPQIDAWLTSDLKKIRALTQASGARLLLQTYMPEKAGFEKPADKVIRKFASENSIPLSDTSRHFFQIEPDSKKRERFYTKWYGEFDNHLGEAGYQIIAELLETDFERIGWIPKRAD